jgi:hypothetical protein
MHSIADPVKNRHSTYRYPVNNVPKDVKYNLCSSQQRDQECRLGRKCRKCRKHEDKKVISVRGLGSDHGKGGGVLISSHGNARTAVRKTFSFRYSLTLVPRRLFFSFFNIFVHIFSALSVLTDSFHSISSSMRSLFIVSF